MLTGFKDRNGIITQTLYNDSFDRPTQIKAALGTSLENHTAVYYAPTSAFGVSLTNNDALTAKDQASLNDGNLRSWTHTDGFGRTIESWSSDPQGNVKVATLYDGLGRAVQTSNPFRPSVPETQYNTTTAYDLLGRVRTVTTADSAVVTSAYSGARVLVTDQAGKQRISQTDGLGRLTDVWEVTAADSATEPVTFPESTVAAGYRTTYSYNVLDDLLTAKQRVGTGGTLQTRTFVYDGLKRLTQAINPESGTINYTYDGNSNLQTKQDARSITTTYTYDALNRVASRTYANDPQNTPAVSYKYDAQSLPTGFPPTFDRGFSTGRLVAVTYGGTSAGNYTGYDRLGRANVSFQQTDSQNYRLLYGYNLASQMTSEKYPSDKEIRTTYDTAGRLNDVKRYINDVLDKTYASQFSYTAHGAVAAMQLGNGKWEHTTFNNRLEPTQIGLGTSGTDSSILKLDYAYGTTSNNGNVMSQTITAPSLTVNQCYGYDLLNRLSTAEERSGGTTCAGTQQWKQAFTYDRFGNRNFDVVNTTSNVLGPNPTISQSTNRIASGQNYGYDNAGNLTSDPATNVNGIVYDAENRQTQYTKSQQATNYYYYDGDGHRVKKIDSSGTTVFVYNAGGQLIAEYTSGTPSGGGTSYLTSDHLGSTRVVMKSDGTTTRHDFLPFGEEIQAGIGGRTAGQGYVPDNVRQKFTQKERDSESGLDYFGARYYSSPQGRFTSVDAGGFKKRHLINPQKWNRYAYTINNPLKYFDPDGLEELVVYVRSFIPQSSKWGYAGDNRNPGDKGTYRTEQRIVIETDPSKNNGQPLVSHTPKTGISIGPTFNPNGVSSVNPSPIVVGVDQASGKTLKADASQDKSGVVNIHAHGNESDPLAPGAPGITYNLNINVQSQGAQGDATVTVTGEHDRFPGYEVIVERPEAENNGPTVVHQFDPRVNGNTPLSLFPLAPNEKVNTTPTVIPPKKRPE